MVAPLGKVEEIVSRHHKAMLEELGLSVGTGNSDINPIAIIRVQQLMDSVTSHFVYDIKHMMKK